MQSFCYINQRLGKSTLYLCLIFSIIFFNNQIAYSQNQGIITGKIIDKNEEKPLTSATITLIKAENKSIVTGAVSDKNGNFALKAPFGQYMLKISFVGYKTHITKNLLLKKNSNKLDLGVIPLQATALVSDEVTITAEKENVVIGIDKRIFNVEKDLVTTAGTATDVLKNLPSVSVDQEGNVKMNGASVKILIDGKESNLSSDVALQSIPAALISSVELITNPSAKYEAEGISGIIDIILKKERDDGLNAFISLRGGSSFEDNKTKNNSASFDANYKISKFNIFGNFSLYSHNGVYDSFGNRKSWENPNDTNYINRINDIEYEGLWLRGKLGVDYNFTKKDVLTFYVSSSGGNHDNDTKLFATYSNNNGITKKTENISESTYPRTSIRTGLSFKKDFQEKNHTLWADIYYNDRKKEPENKTILTYTVPNVYEFKQRQIPRDNTRKSFTAKIDYIRPLKYIGNFEAGAKFRTQDINSQDLFENHVAQEWETDLSRSDKYQYNESINSIYALFSNKFSKFGYKIGTRLENTNYEFTQQFIDTNFSKNYLSIIPTVHLSYNINQANSIRLNYTRRLKRPRLSSLNPRMLWSPDSSNASMGNPNVEAEYYNSYEGSYVLFTPKTTVSLSAYYRNTDNAIENFYKILKQGTVLASPENLSENSTLGSSANLMQSLFDWWRINLNFNYYKINFESNSITGIKKRTSYSWNAYFNSYFNISKNINLQLSGYYYPGYKGLQSENPDYYSLNLGGQYKLLDNKLTINVNFNNILYPKDAKASVYADNFYFEQIGTWTYPSFTLGISYKFNNYKQSHRKRNTDEEMPNQEGESMETGLQP